MKKRLPRALARVRDWGRRAEFTLARRFGLATAEDRAFFLLIPLVGVVAGLLGVAVHRLIALVRTLLWGQGENLVEAALRTPALWIVGALVAGGAVVALIARVGGEPLSGGGMSVLIESVALGGGRVPARPIILRALGAVATVGSGGSLGREGPMIRLGAMIASWLAQRMGLSTHRIKILVGCGAAAGLAAAYNIPVGGALFAMEVILGNFALEIFGPIVVSSVISTLIARGFEGNSALYASPGYQLNHYGEIFAYVGLGVVGGLASIVFVLGVRRVGGLVQRLPLRTLHPVVGMAGVGGLAVVFPHVLGGGVETIHMAIQGELPLELLLLLPLAKLAATALTSGSGGAGGLFTPSLCCGALLGGAYGVGIERLVPAASSGAYALVGMAAMAAGTSHAPISAILILFEFTGEYELILPLMLSAIVSGLLSRSLYRYSIYTESLMRRGIDLSWRMEEVVLAGLKVGDLVRRDRDLLRPADDYRKVVEKFLATHRQRLFVVDGGDRLLGTVSLHDIKHALDDPGALRAVVAHDLMMPARQVLSADQGLDEAAEMFARSDFERLPVVEQDRFVGHLSKRDLLSIYAQEVLGRPALLATFTSGLAAESGRDYVELPPDFSIRLVTLPGPLVGKELAQVRLPQRLGARVIQIRRLSKEGERLVIPDGSTILEPGDRLIVLGPTAALQKLERGEGLEEEPRVGS